MHRQCIYSVHYKRYYTQAINPLATQKKNKVRILNLPRLTSAFGFARGYLLDVKANAFL